VEVSGVLVKRRYEKLDEEEWIGRKDLGRKGMDKKEK
jgi:hypothetical protein